MANNHKVVALKKHCGEIKVGGIDAKLNLPDGCSGVLFCFDSKKSAIEYWGKDIELIQYREEAK